jgi:hypothetical protein
MENNESRLLNDLLCPESDVDTIVEKFVSENRRISWNGILVPVASHSPHRSLFAPRPADETHDEGIQTDSVMVRVLHSPPRSERLPLRPPTPELVERTPSLRESESYSYSSYTGSSDSLDETLQPTRPMVPSILLHANVSQGKRAALSHPPNESNFRKLLLEAPEQRRKTVTMQIPQHQPKAKASCFC